MIMIFISARWLSLLFINGSVNDLFCLSLSFSIYLQGFGLGFTFSSFNLVFLFYLLSDSVLLLLIILLFFFFLLFRPFLLLILLIVLLLELFLLLKCACLDGVLGFWFWVFEILLCIMQIVWLDYYYCLILAEILRVRKTFTLRYSW